MDGTTRWNASSAEPPCAVGSVSGPMTPSSSITEPGQPCVMISGNALSWRDLTWMKWMSTPLGPAAEADCPLLEIASLLRIEQRTELTVLRC